MKKTGKTGFTLLEIMIVVTIIGFLAGLAIPGFMKVRSNAQKAKCIDNLRQIAGYKDAWAVENFKNNGDTVDSTDIGSFFKRGFPTCPGGGTYNIGLVGENPTCSLGPLGHALP